MEHQGGDDLASAAARYRLLLDAMEDGYCLIEILLDEDGRPVDYRFLEANPAFEQHTGLRGALGRTAREMVPDLDASWFQRYGRVALTGESARFESHAPAMKRWFEVFAIRVGPPQARQVALLFKNSTERNEAEAERRRLLKDLEAAHLRLLNLFQEAPAFVASLRSPEHVFEMVNPLYQQLVGMHRKLVGRSVREALPEVVPQGFIDLLDRVYRTGEPYVGRESHLQVDRGRGGIEDVYVTFVYQARRNGQGEVDGIDVFGFEVTTEVQGRQRAEALAEQLRQAGEFEQQLIGIVSHDLRNPLNAITLSAAMLLRRAELDAPQRRTLGRILSSAERATRLIRDLLDFSLVRAKGGLPVRREPTDLHAVARQVVEELQVMESDRRIRLEQTGSGLGVWDSDRIAQVLGNLLSNALHHGASRSEVRVRTRGEADAVFLEVHNEGAPIAPEVFPLLFQPMQRGVGHGESSNGSVGLGLYIVDQAVRAHGGSVSVASNREEGTTFTVRLPRQPAAEEAAGASW